MIFGDTSYFVALIDRKDQWHRSAVRLRRELQDEIVVTDLVVVETVTLVGSRAGGTQAQAVYRYFKDSCTIDFVDSRTLDEAMIYHQRFDGALSLADCASVVAMIRRGLSKIASFDTDFDRVKGLSRLA